MFKKIAVKCVLFASAFFKYFQPRACRFYPSCSAYSVEAFERLGLFKGFLKTIHRICRCHPFCEGGYDPLTEGSQ